MPSPQIAAEAAVWIARLHGPERSALVERECRAWQARSAAHRTAFERCTDAWLDVEGLVRAGSHSVSRPLPMSTGSGRMTRRQAWAVGACVALAVGTWRFWPTECYRTGVGQQLAVDLPDGSRMTLNTATRVRVRFDRGRRQVDVQEGEALFEVAKDAVRRFVVRVADVEVLAKGTVFAVRFTPRVSASEALTVSLLEGEVDVRGGGMKISAVLAAGERVRVDASSAGPGIRSGRLLRDRPNLGQTLAWRRGEAVFDATPLAQAVAEMNRYCATPIELAADGVDILRISGVFRTGGSEAFAGAVARLFGLRVRRLEGRWVLGAS